MLTGFLREQDRTQDRLLDELLRHTARETEMHARIDQRFHDQEDVGWTSPAERRRHVHEVLVVDADRQPHRFQYRPNQPLVLRRDRRRWAPHGRPVPDLGWRIRHRTHDSLVSQP